MLPLTSSDGNVTLLSIVLQSKLLTHLSSLGRLSPHSPFRSEDGLLPCLIALKCVARVEVFQKTADTHTCVCCNTSQGIAANAALLVHKDDVATVIREDPSLAKLHAQL